MPTEVQHYVRTDLAKRMIARADADSLPNNHELRTVALDFDIVASGYNSEPPTHTVKQMIAAWTKARKLWSAYSGEPLI